MPLTAAVTGDSIPDAQDHLELVPARVLAIAGNSLGTLAAVAVALRDDPRRRPRGNTLLLAGIAVAAVGSALAGLGAGESACFRSRAALLLYGGFVVNR